MTKNCPTCRGDVSEKEIERPVIHTNDVFTSKWLYQGRDGVKWWRYDEETSEIIEKGYQSYLQDNESEDPKFHIGNNEYAIDFGAMKQYNIHVPGRSRTIRRVEPCNAGSSSSDAISEDLINGIGGIKIVKVPPPRNDDAEILVDE